MVLHVLFKWATHQSNV